jgi:hypothetical protein
VIRYQNGHWVDDDTDQKPTQFWDDGWAQALAAGSAAVTNPRGAFDGGWTVKGEPDAHREIDNGVTPDSFVFKAAAAAGATTAAQMFQLQLPTMNIDYFYAYESKTGDYYYGYTYDNAGKYFNGESWTSATTDQLGGHWSYNVYSVGPADGGHQSASNNGYTYDTSYYDAGNGTAYTSFYGGANGTPTSSTGIGPDYDYIYQDGSYKPFGLNGYYVVPEAPPMKIDYFYAIESKTGDVYYGYTYDNAGKYVYGESWTSATTDQLGGHWSYGIYSVGTADSAHQSASNNGYTYDYSYYDADNGTSYATYNGANGTPTSSTGIGPDYDYIYQNGLYQPFGSNGYFVVPESMKIDYFYAVESKTGDVYYGYTYDNVVKYVNGASWISATTDQLGGHWSYTVYQVNVADSAHQSASNNGYTYDYSYYDADNGTLYTTYNGGANGTPTSSTGIGPDYDYIYQNGAYQPFGNGYYVVPDMKIVSFYAHESKTGDIYNGYTYDNVFKYVKGESWTSPNTDQLGGHWDYTISSVDNADSAHQNPGWNGYTYHTSYYDWEEVFVIHATYYGTGTATSTTGIGPDYDYIYDSQDNTYKLFGLNGYYVVNDGGASPQVASANGGSGGHSSPDTFVFVGNFGQQTVDSFTPGNQTIALDHNEFVDFSAVLAHAVQVDADVVITLDDHDAITLKNLMLSSLHAADFHFA